MNKYKVSVVMPVYNCVLFLHEAVDGILNQTFKDFEFVIVEDCSTDGSKEIIKDYADRYANIKVIWHEVNKGLSRSLNDGLAAASGDLIAIQHGDDVSLPQRLEKQVAYLKENENVHLLSTWVKLIDEHSKAARRDSWWIKQIKGTADNPEVLKQKMLEMNIFVHTSVMFRSSVIDSVGTYGLDMVPAEDFDLWLRIADNHDLGILREVLCLYRHHSNQISGTDSGNLMKAKAAIAIERAKERRK